MDRNRSDRETDITTNRRGDDHGRREEQPDRAVARAPYRGDRREAQGLSLNAAFSTRGGRKWAPSASSLAAPQFSPTAVRPGASSPANWNPIALPARWFSASPGGSRCRRRNCERPRRRTRHRSLAKNWLTTKPRTRHRRHLRGWGVIPRRTHPGQAHHPLPRSAAQGPARRAGGDPFGRRPGHRLDDAGRDLGGSA